jgi:hypothetical protein
VSSEAETEEELGGMSFFNSLRLDADEENPCRLWEPSKLLLHLEGFLHRLRADVFHELEETTPFV